MMQVMDEQPFRLKNRHERRRFIVNFRKAKIESVERGTAGPGHHPCCDQIGCLEPWAFSTWATIEGKRQRIAKRCPEHRMV